MRTRDLCNIYGHRNATATPFQRLRFARHMLAEAEARFEREKSRIAELMLERARESHTKAIADIAKGN
jgi:hypothetical protein